MTNNQAKYVPKEWDHLIMYSHFKAYKAGQKGFPIDHMNELGYNVVNFEILRDYGVTLFEVTSRIEDPPECIEELPPFWEFEFKQPL
jgi:hypothetical protein